MNKVVADADEAIKDIQDGACADAGRIWSLWYSGKLYCSIGKKRSKDLTCISNNAGVDDFGIGLMLQAKAGKKNDIFLCRRKCRI